MYNNNYLASIEINEGELYLDKRDNMIVKVIRDSKHSDLILRIIFSGININNFQRTKYRVGEIYPRSWINSSTKNFWEKL